MSKGGIHDKCPVCGNKVLLKKAGYEFAHLVSCKKCSFIFSHRIPPPNELQMCYANYGQEEYLSAITIKRFEELLVVFEKFRKNNRILDLGCGYGNFLNVAKSQGWEVFGTEFSDRAISICESKGIKVKKAGFSVENFEPDFFDIITASEVIEHLENPCISISNVIKGLREGGAIYLTTPNFNSLLRFRLGPKYNIISHPEHLSYFSKKSLNHCLKKNSLKKVFLKSHGLSVTRLKASQKAN